LPLAASVLKPPLLAGLLAEHADVIRPRVNEKGDTIDVEVSPPGPVLAAVLARRSWPGLPVLRRIISTPVLRPDGTLLQTPGYDPPTGSTSPPTATSTPSRTPPHLSRSPKHESSCWNGSCGTSPGAAPPTERTTSPCW
jgi:hypothetical protein